MSVLNFGSSSSGDNPEVSEKYGALFIYLQPRIYESDLAALMLRM